MTKDPEPLFLKGFLTELETPCGPKHMHISWAFSFKTSLKKKDVPEILCDKNNWKGLK